MSVHLFGIMVPLSASGVEALDLCFNVGCRSQGKEERLDESQLRAGSSGNEFGISHANGAVAEGAREQATVRNVLGFHILVLNCAAAK